MMRGRRMGRPGLVGTMARTAVVAGTATAVSGAMVRGRQNRAATAQAQQETAVDEAVDERMAQAPPPPPPAAPAAPAADDLVAKVKELADLKSQGLLSEEEFAAGKAKLLAG